MFIAQSCRSLGGYDHYYRENEDSKIWILAHANYMKFEKERSQHMYRL